MRKSSCWMQKKVSLLGQCHWHWRATSPFQPAAVSQIRPWISFSGDRRRLTLKATSFHTARRSAIWCLLRGWSDLYHCPLSSLGHCVCLFRKQRCWRGPTTWQEWWLLLHWLSTSTVLAVLRWCAKALTQTWLFNTLTQLHTSWASLSLLFPLILPLILPRPCHPCLTSPSFSLLSADSPLSFLPFSACWRCNSAVMVDWHWWSWWWGLAEVQRCKDSLGFFSWHEPSFWSAYFS